VTSALSTVTVSVSRSGSSNLGLAEDEHLGLLHCLAVELGERVVDRLGQHRAPADPHVDDARRHLARTEPGDARLLRDFAVSLVEARLKLLEGNLDAQPDTGRAQLFDSGLHGGVTPETWMVTARMSSAAQVYGG
jgi:hypothetical protein